MDEVAGPAGIAAVGRAVPGPGPHHLLRGIKRTSLWAPADQTLDLIEAGETDNRFIELAVAGKARYIITGDKRHLLPLRRYQGIEIVSPAEFLALYKSSNV